MFKVVYSNLYFGKFYFNCMLCFLVSSSTKSVKLHAKEIQIIDASFKGSDAEKVDAVEVYIEKETALAVYM